MKRRFIDIVILSMGLLQIAQAADEASLMIEYAWSGGFSNIEKAEVCVQDNGNVTVKYSKQEQKPIEYGFALDRDEVAALTSLVQAIKFFDQPTNDTAFATDVGESTLTVSVGKMRRTLRYRYRSELDPLAGALWELIQQGIVTTELQVQDDTYQAMVASSPHLVGRKVYCPRLLVVPLKETIANCRDRQKLEWGLTALAWLQTKNQWLGVVSSQLAEADDDRKALLLSVLGSHPFYDNIPDSHARIMLPVFTAILDTFAESKNRIPPNTDEALGIVCRFLGAKNYDRCISTLTKLRQVHGESNAGRWAGWAIESINTTKRDAQP